MYVERVWFARWLIWIALIYIFGAFDADGGSWRGHGYASWEWEWMAARAKRIIPRIRISDTSSACRVQGRDLGMRNGAPTSKLKWKLNRYTCVVVHSENRAQSRFAFNQICRLALRLRSRCHSNPFFQFLRRCVCVTTCRCLSLTLPSRFAFDFDYFCLWDTCIVNRVDWAYIPNWYLSWVSQCQRRATEEILSHPEWNVMFGKWRFKMKISLRVIRGKSEFLRT